MKGIANHYRIEILLLIAEHDSITLEDIVETIQKSQMDIIEADPRQICIVQGCVGSGKSTVAIHKLSHIFFNHSRLIRPERSILIAKNQILVGYLSTLFPKLGIFGLNYGTLKDILVRIIFSEGLGLAIDFDNPSTDIGKKISFIKELDINPLKISDKTAEGVAVDGRIEVNMEEAKKALGLGCGCGCGCSSRYFNKKRMHLYKGAFFF